MEARPEDVVAPVEQSVVDIAVYCDGERISTPAIVAEAARQIRDEPGTMAWIGMLRPTEVQIIPVADEFGFHEVAVEDAVVAHQRPKLER
jgi:magnesium transporter